MTIELFVSERIDFTVNERRQYERIKKEMIEKLSSIKLRYCIIVDLIIANKQYDIIVIKNDAIIIIDLKGYRRIHFGSFILIYKIDGSIIKIISLDHHDKSY